MNCGTFLNIGKPKKSKLYRDLVHKYGQNKAKYIYDDVIWGEGYHEHSFPFWLSKRTYETTKQGEPALNEYLEWRKYIYNLVQTQKTFATNKIVLDPSEFSEISQSITGLIPEVLKEKGLTFADIQDGNTKLSNIRNVVFKRMINQLEENIDNDIDENGPDQWNKRNRDIQKEIEANQNFFLDAYNIHLKSVMNLTFDAVSDTESLMNDKLEEAFQKSTKNTAYNKAANEFSVLDNSTKAVKMLIASLKTNEYNRFGFRKLVDYHKTFSMIHQQLVNKPGDIDLYIELLKEKQKYFPQIKELIDELNFDMSEFTYDINPKVSFKQQRLRTLFVNQFNKTKYEYILDVKDDEDAWSIINENLDKTANIKLAEWENNFEAIKSKGLPKYTSVQLRGMSKREFLKAIGVKPLNINNIPNNIVEEIQKRGVPNIEEFKTIYQRKAGKKKVFDIRARLLKIAEIDALNDPEIVELQHYNIDNKLVYGISLNTFLSNRVKDINYYSRNTEELKENFPELYDDPYSSSSIIADRIKEGEKIELEVISGMRNRNTGKGRATSELSKKDLVIQRIHHVLQEGTYHFFRAAERKIENAFKFENRRNKNGLFVDIDHTEKNYALAKLYFIRHLDAELRTNEFYKLSGVKNSNVSDTTTRVFEIERPDGTIDNLLEKKKGIYDMSVEELQNDPTIQKFIDDKIEEIIKIEKEYFDEHNVSEKDYEGLHKLYGNASNALASYAINSYIGKLELSKIFTGDPVLYEDSVNFFKRMSMFNSTKESTRVDSEMDDFISTLQNNLELKAQGENYKPRSGHFAKTITIQEILSNIESFSKEEVDTIKQVLGDTSLYNGIKEADGFAWITYDEYRIMKNRYNDWTELEEELYQKITSQEDFEIEDKYNNSILPDKSQFVGKLQNDNHSMFAMIGGRKFAFMPLIPTMFKKDSTLDKINQQMLKNGVGMAFFESAAKFGYHVDEKNNATHKVYDDKTNKFILDISSGEFDILDYSDFGNQLKIRRELKSTIAESVQKRRLNFSNFFKNGELIDESLTDLMTNYENLQQERIRRAYSTLSKKLGFNEVNKEQKVKKFIESISSSAKLQNFTSNELMALELLKDLPYLDTLQNKARVEQFIMAKLKNGVISQKRRGTSLAQVSNVGFELNPEAVRGDLKFYRIKNGRMLPMEVYSPLPKELTSFVANKYGDGKLTHKAIEAFNKDIEEDNKIYEETGVKSNITRMTIMVGFRTPNQGPSSSDVAKVKAYYPPYIGSMVVVPKALVIKTGSDFDIDKLNLYTPAINSDISRERANSYTRKIFKNNTGALIRALQADDIGENHSSQKLDTLRDWFIEGILRQDPAELTNDRNIQVYQKGYLDELKSFGKNLETSYVTPEGAIEDMTKEELDNMTLENEIEITLHSANWKQLLTPLDTDHLDPHIKTVRKATNYKKKTQWSKIFHESTNIDKMFEFLSGPTGVGQVAVQITNHALAQKAGLMMKAHHDYFGVSKPLVKPKSTEEVTPILVKEINELVSKPELQFNFIDSSQLVNFEDATQKMLMQEKLKKKADELQETINCIWKA